MRLVRVGYGLQGIYAAVASGLPNRLHALPIKKFGVFSPQMLDRLNEAEERMDAARPELWT